MLKRVVAFGKSRAAAVGSLTAASVFVWAAQRRTRDPLWVPANVLTLSRCVAAVGLAAQSANRERRASAWIGLLLGCTLTDWLDGPIARRRKTTSLGAILDIEADSWLTLWAAVAAWRSGALPVWCLSAPVLRYPVRVGSAAHRSMGARVWQRAAGTLQMVVFCSALAPWGRVRAVAARLAFWATLGQLAALAADVSGED